MSSNKNTEFTRRKFTITEDLDSELERLASNHYQGNVSLCLRQAITDHRETLNGKGRLTLKRLAANIESMNERIRDLAGLVETTAENVQAQDTHYPSSGAGSLRTGSNRRQDAQQIVALLEDTGRPMRAEDIIEQVDLSPIAVREALGYLIDRGHIVETPTDPPRYQLAQITTPSD